MKLETVGNQIKVTLTPEEVRMLYGGNVSLISYFDGFRVLVTVEPDGEECEDGFCPLIPQFGG